MSSGFEIRVPERMVLQRTYHLPARLTIDTSQEAKQMFALFDRYVKEVKGLKRVVHAQWNPIQARFHHLGVVRVTPA
jgi:hypothetical protein